MRILGVGETNDLGDMYLRLMAKGHDVRVHMSDENSHDVMQGMIDFVSDWRASLDWVREAGSDGIVLFETANLGHAQDELRQRGFNVVGGSALGDRLENERSYGQGVLQNCGLNTVCTREFSSFDGAIQFLRDFPGRYVFKLNGANWPSTRNYVGQMDNGEDMISLLIATRNSWSLDERPSFVLMEFVDGVEVGVGAFFNGEQFLTPANLDWEHKRFFPGDIGELTGEMGTVVTYDGASPLFDRTLGRLAPLLRETGYCGYINLNTIINDRGIWPLELTCRFGYPGFAILDSLHEDDWGVLLSVLANRTAPSFRVKKGFSVGVVLTVPPFPYPDGYDQLGRGTPICFRDSMTHEDHESLHLGEVSMCDGQLTTAGMVGYTMVVTGIGATIGEARKVVYDRIDKVVIPNARYRKDIGVRLIDTDWSRLKGLGWVN